MIIRLNPSVTKKLVLLAFLTVATFFVTSRVNQNEAPQAAQIINTNNPPASSEPPDVTESLSDFRSSYKFIEQRARKKH